MDLRVRIANPGSAPKTLHVTVDDACNVDAFADALAKASGGDAAEGVWVDTVRLDGGALVSTTPIRQGSLLALSEAAARPDKQKLLTSGKGWQLHCVGGVDSGTVIELPVGSHELGRQGKHGLVDGSMSRRHAELQVSESGVTILDLGSSNGTSVDGKKVPMEGEGAPLEVPFGAIIAMGDNLFCLRNAAEADAPVVPAPGGTLELTRPPRLRPPASRTRIRLPDEPEKRKARKVPLVGLAAPLILGVVMALVEKAPTYLLFAVASPIMAVGNLVSDRRTNNKEHLETVEAYRKRFDEATRQLETALVAETQLRRTSFPDPPALLAIATGPGRRLWERRRRDSDFLELRVGTADLPSNVEVESSGARSDADAQVPSGPRTLFSVPATFNLREAGVAGVAGPPAAVDSMTRWLVCQLACLHPPRDLSLTLLTAKTASHWDWIRWLPHANPNDPDSMVASVGNDAETVAARIGELASTVRARKSAIGDTRPDPISFPAHVVIVDDARSMRAVPGLAQILKDGPQVGVFAICSAHEDRFLPEECTTVVQLDEAEPAFLDLRVSGHPELPKVLADAATVPFATSVSVSLSPVRDATAEEGDIALPDSARLLDVLAMEPPTADAVRARWLLEGRTTRMAIGVGSSGAFELDLRRDGPHGLVAGTTGAGKSEFLQTMIASLAVSNRPENLSFVLVDYKGGSAFKDCVKLPHTVGMVTDLDAHLVERAIVSLSAELKRREHILAAVGAKDIEDYCELFDKGEASAPLARLVIVIDEFASMARELPDFVTGLVNIAQRGRSLGIHLILATQRPSGVVSPEIRANTNLRVSLRVTDATDSTDVIDAPDAARISKSTPGRGYARLGHSALEPFQAGRIGGRRPGARPDKLPPPFVAEVGWGQLGYAPPEPPKTPEAEQSVETDLAVLVETVREAAAQEGSSAQPSPWLPALPDKLTLDELTARWATPPDGIAGDAGGRLAPIVFGLQDLPAEQRQEPATFDLQGGHLYVLGSSRSGRSQLLRTLAGAAAQALSTADLHIYAVDAGNGALAALSSFPHTGAVASAAQGERVSRLIGRLAKEVDRRQKILASGGFADITEQRRATDSAHRLSHILVLVDRWEGFVARFGEVDSGRLVDGVMSLLRDGAAVGVHVIATGDRSLGVSKMGSMCDNKIALRFADRGDYTYVGVNARLLPEVIEPGRCFSCDKMVEIQVALLCDDESGPAQAAALAQIAERATVRDVEVPRDQRPFRVDELPSRVSYEQAGSYPRPAGSGLFALVGVGGDELVALGPDLASNPTFVLAGPARSGRSTALVAMARSLLDSGAELVLATPRKSQLADLEPHPGVRGLLDEASAGLDRWTVLLGVRERPLVVVIDDGEMLRDSPAGESLREVMRQPGRQASGLILGGHVEGLCAGIGGWQVEAKKARQGVLLSPQNLPDGELIGAKLTRGQLSSTPTPGRGLLHLGDGDVIQVAIPTA